MKTSIKKLWVDALRSGKYQQGKKQLRTGEKFCCLGVLCDLYHKETGEGKWVDNAFWVDRVKADVALPFAVVEWSGCPDANPDVKAGLGIGNLATANDYGATFSKIADIIEAQL